MVSSHGGGQVARWSRLFPLWSCFVTPRRRKLHGRALPSTRWSGRRSGDGSLFGRRNCVAGEPWRAVAQQSCAACGTGWRRFRARSHEITVRHAGNCSSCWRCSASRGGRRQPSNGPLEPEDGPKMAEEGHPSSLVLVLTLVPALVLAPASQWGVPLCLCVRASPRPDRRGGLLGWPQMGADVRQVEDVRAAVAALAVRTCAAQWSLDALRPADGRADGRPKGARPAQTDTRLIHRVS